MSDITIPRLYLDVCCLNRPFDDQSQERIRLESEAVILILRRFEAQAVHWICSEVVDFEIEQMPDPDRKQRVRLLLSHVTTTLKVEPADVARGQELEVFGFQTYDALHIACAERGGADVFLTTDDRVIKRALRLSEELHTRVMNPLAWLTKETEA